MMGWTSCKSGAQRGWAAAALAIACLAPAPWLAFAEEDVSQVPIEWRMPVVQKDTILPLLDLGATPSIEPVDDSRRGDRSRGVPMILLIGAVSLPYLADAVIAAYRDVMLGGVVVNACNDGLEIRNDQALPGEVMVVKCGDQTEVWRSRDPQPSELVNVLLQALGGKK